MLASNDISNQDCTGTPAYSLNFYGNPADPALLLIGSSEICRTFGNKIRHRLLQHHYQLIVAEARHPLSDTPTQGNPMTDSDYQYQFSQLLKLLPIKPALLAEGVQAAYALLCLTQSKSQLATELILINLSVPTTLSEKIDSAFDSISIPVLNIRNNDHPHSNLYSDEEHEDWNNQTTKIIHFLDTRIALGLPT